ncbi:2-phospho-L-lactate guanylyltransferase, partial [Segeticoccus rhizosphaerae]
MPPPPNDWRIVVPVKDQAHAKSRLHPPDGVERAALAHAFALDTLSAVFATLPPAHVVVVSSDAAIRTFAEGRGARVEADPAAGLNLALRQGLRRIAEEPFSGGTGLLLGDLPALRPEDLEQALVECAKHPRSVVPDATGEGTVLLAAQRRGDLEPRFGPGSARAHAERA